jgi:anionic cell wall polymer biosynthesis LytR-Cps2A-Psr (LCP) family protein
VVGWPDRAGGRGARLGAVLAVTGVAWSRYRNLDAGIRRPGSLEGLSATSGAAQNLLVMGLDSRLDENGDPLPPMLYEALETGGPDVGGYNANVLMLLHIPGDGSRATAISLPRDDYVDLVGSPDGVAKGKINRPTGWRSTNNTVRSSPRG